MTHSHPYDAGTGDFDGPGDVRPRESGRHEPGHDAEGAERDRPDADGPDGLDDLDDLDDERARAAELEELRRYEAEREEKRRRRDSASRKVVAWIVALALAFLLYDSGGALARRISAGEPWGTHAVMAALAALGLAALLAAGVRAIRRK